MIGAGSILFSVVIFFYIDQRYRLDSQHAQDEYWNYKMSEFQDAKNLWDETAVHKYRLSIEFRFSFIGSCTKDWIVEDNKVVEVLYEEKCPSSPHEENIPVNPIEDLFARIEKSIDEKRCGANGCLCEGPLAPDVVYDNIYGYPQQARIKIHPDKAKMDYRNIFAPRSYWCHTMGTVPPSWTLTTFQPMP